MILRRCQPHADIDDLMMPLFDAAIDNLG